MSNKTEKNIRLMNTLIHVHCLGFCLGCMIVNVRHFHLHMKPMRRKIVVSGDVIEVKRIA